VQPGFAADGEGVILTAAAETESLNPDIRSHEACARRHFDLPIDSLSVTEKDATALQSLLL
jgi:hypothetical protein